MTYTKRPDGRKFDEARDMEAKVGIIPRSNGSAMFRIGKTIAIASVFGPKAVFPKFLQNPKTGILRCYYDMMSFSVPDRKRPGPNRRSQELSLITKKSLLPALDLKQYPNSVVDVYIQIVQADAGTRCAGICAASMALADAGIPMSDLVVAISVGKVGDKVVVDLDKEEEDHPEGATDVPIAILPRTNKLTLLQLDGDMTKEELKQSIELSKKVCKQIYEIQEKALKEKYKGE